MFSLDFDMQNITTVIYTLGNVFMKNSTYQVGKNVIASPMMFIRGSYSVIILEGFNIIYIELTKSYNIIIYIEYCNFTIENSNIRYFYIKTRYLYKYLILYM